MVWISIALVVLGVAFVLRGALLSGSGAIRFPIRSVRLPSARTALIVGGVAAVAVLGTAAMNVDGARTNRATALVDTDDRPRRSITLMAPAAPAAADNSPSTGVDAPANRPSVGSEAQPAPAPQGPAIANTDDGDGDKERTANNRQSRTQEEEPEPDPTSTPASGEPDDDEDKGSDDGKKSDDGGGRDND